jgi:hypothetical protein
MRPADFFWNMRRRFSGIGRRTRMRFMGPDDLHPGLLHDEAIAGRNEVKDSQAPPRHDGNEQQESAVPAIQLEGSIPSTEMTEEERFMRDSLDRFGAESSHHGYERHMLERD